jgi:MFS family permease
VDEISIKTVLNDRICFLALFESFLGSYIYDFYVGFLSLHMKEEFGVRDSQMGFYFMVSGLTYLFGCAFVPSFFTRSPPKVVMTGGFLICVFGVGLMGPSKVLHLPNNLWLIIIGLGSNTLGTCGTFSFVVSEVQKRLTLKHQIIEGSDSEMEGKLSDQISSVYLLSSSLGIAFAPMIGTEINSLLGYRNCMDFHMILIFVSVIMLAIFFNGFTPFSDHEEEMKELERLKNLSAKLNSIRSKYK